MTQELFELPPDIETLDLSEEQELTLSFEQTPESPNTEAVQSQPDASNEAETSSLVDFQFDLNDIHGSIRRLQDQDPKIANVINSMVGEKAKRAWEPKLQQTQLELERLQRQLLEVEVNTIPEAERNQRIASDSEFAEKVNQLRDQPDFDGRQAQLNTLQQIYSIVEEASERGLSEETIGTYYEKLREGQFDKDSEGNVLSFEASLNSFRRALYDEVIESVRGTKATPQEEPQTPQEPQAPQEPARPIIQDSASPDMSGNNSASRGTKFTLNQIQAMNPDELLLHFPNDGDYERAIINGNIEGVSPETVEILRRA